MCQEPAFPRAVPQGSRELLGYELGRKEGIRMALVA